MGVDLGKKSGAISLQKSERVTIEKSAKIVATVSFSKDVDYDVYAVILFKDGSEKVCSTFGSATQPEPTPVVGGIRHLGDVVRGGASVTNTETLEIVLSDDVAKVAVVAYSAQSNGDGSFRRYQVSTTVDNGAGTVVTVAADAANDDDAVYTCVPAILTNSVDGVSVERVEFYSARASENRPAFNARETTQTVRTGLFKKETTTIPAGELIMDAGAQNIFK